MLKDKVIEDPILLMNLCYRIAFSSACVSAGSQCDALRRIGTIDNGLDNFVLN